MFKAAASADWATGARGASGGQRSRNLRDVNAALCQLSYAGLVGSGGFEPPSPVYQTGARNPCATIRGWPGGNRTRNRVYIRHLRSHCATGHRRRETRDNRWLYSPCLMSACLHLVGRRGFAPPQQCGAFTERWARSCPAGPLVGAAPGNRTLTACLEGRYARRYATAAWNGPASRPRTYNRLIKSQLLRQLSYSGMLVPPKGLEPLSPRLKGACSGR